MTQADQQRVKIFTSFIEVNITQGNSIHWLILQFSNPPPLTSRAKYSIIQENSSVSSSLSTFPSFHKTMRSLSVQYSHLLRLDQSPSEHSRTAFNLLSCNACSTIFLANRQIPLTISKTLPLKGGQKDRSVSKREI